MGRMRLKGRIMASVIVVFCWLIFAISFLAFYPTNFDLWQNIAFFIVSGLISIGIVAMMWIRMIPL